MPGKYFEDLEDGVALNRKAEARAGIAEALTTLDFGRAERLMRVNPVGSGFESDDLAAVLAARPDGLVIPKVESAEQVRWVISRTGSLPLLIQIETAPGLVNLKEIAAADPRITALIFGAEDFAASVGAKRTREGREVLYARSAVVACAAAFGFSSPSRRAARRWPAPAGSRKHSPRIRPPGRARSPSTARWWIGRL